MLKDKKFLEYLQAGGVQVCRGEAGRAWREEEYGRCERGGKIRRSKGSGNVWNKRGERREQGAAIQACRLGKRECIGVGKRVRTAAGRGEWWRARRDSESIFDDGVMTAMRNTLSFMQPIKGNTKGGH